MVRRLLAHCWLALLLVFAQQVGVVHAASHAPSHAPTHEHGKGVKMQACDECVAAAHVQPAPGTVSQAPTFAGDDVLAAAGSTGGIVAQSLTGFLTRAPPGLA